jgi:hypothetical protein
LQGCGGEPDDGAEGPRVVAQFVQGVEGSLAAGLSVWGVVGHGLEGGAGPASGRDLVFDVGHRLGRGDAESGGEDAGGVEGGERVGGVGQESV